MATRRGKTYSPFWHGALLDPEFDEGDPDPTEVGDSEKTAFYAASFSEIPGESDHLSITLSTGKKKRRTTRIEESEVLSPPENEPPGWADPTFGET